jgi:DNA polymerase-3 subunit alpha
MAAFLTFESQAQKQSDWMPYLEDARKTRAIDPATGAILRAGIEVRPPDINLSQQDFAVVFEDGETRTAANGHIRFGLGAIKGAGDKAIGAVIDERDGAAERRSDEGEVAPIATPGASAAPSVASSLRRSVARPFTSLFDFCERVPTGPSGINKATIEALVKCGAFDSVHGRKNRAAMLATIEAAVAAGQRMAADKSAGQAQLFGFGGPPEPTPKGKAKGVGAAAPDDGATARLATAEPWSESETLRQEKETLGFYVTSHPLEQWKSWIGVFATHDIAGLRDAAQDARVVVGALVQSTRTIVSKKGQSAGQKMAILTIEDLGGTCDAVMFPGVYALFSHLLTDDAPKFVLGRVDLSRGDPQVIIDRLAPIETVPLEKGRLRVVVREPLLNGGSVAAIDSLREMIVRGVGGQPAGGAGAVNGNGPAGMNGAGAPHGAAAGTATGGRAAGPRPIEADFENPQYPLVPLELIIETAEAWYELKPEGGSARLAPALASEAARVLGVGSLRLKDGVAVELPGQERRRRFGKGE